MGTDTYEVLRSGLDLGSESDSVASLLEIIISSKRECLDRKIPFGVVCSSNVYFVGSSAFSQSLMGYIDRCCHLLGPLWIFLFCEIVSALTLIRFSH